MLAVRTAHVSEFSEVSLMLRHMHAEGKFAHLPYVPEKLTRLFCQLRNQARGEIFVVLHNDKIVGIAVAEICEYFFCHKRFVSDILIYVVPQWRGSRAFFYLVRALEQYTKAQGLAELVLSVSNPADIASASKYYTALGFAPRGQAFVKEL